MGCNLYSLIPACVLSSRDRNLRDSESARQRDIFFLAENKQIAHNLVNAVCNAVGLES